MCNQRKLQLLYIFTALQWNKVNTVTKPVGHERMDVSNVSQYYSQNCKKDIKLKDIMKIPTP